MPHQPSFRPVFLTAACIWLALAGLIAWAGTIPDGYLIYVAGNTDPQPYPLSAVASESGVVAIPLGLLVWACMASRWKRVGRLSVVCLLTAASGVYFALGVMHAAEHYVRFVQSMLGIASLSVLATLILAAICLFKKTESDEPEPATARPSEAS